MSLNRWQGIGNLGNDPEINYLPSGEAVANFSMACSEKYTDKATGEQKEITEWVKLVAFKRRAEVIGEYCKKGSKLFVEGELRTRKWQAQDGQDRYTTEVVVNGFQFLDNKPGNGKAEAQSSYPEAQRLLKQAALMSLRMIFPFSHDG